MKIALIEPVGGHGGMEIYDYGVSSALAHLGNQVHFYTSDKTTLYSFHCNVMVKRYFQGIFSPSFILRRVLNLVVSLFKTFVDIISIRFDVIYLHTFTFSIFEFLLLLFSFFSCRKVIVNVHDPMPLGGSNSKILVYFFSLFFSSSKVLISTHTSYSSKILKSIFPNSNISLMPHSDIDFIHDSKFSKSSAKSKLQVSDSDLLILLFGQIKPTKGVDTLLLAWPAIVEVIPNAKLLIKGRCWRNDCSKYISLIDSLGVSDSVLFDNSYVNDSDVPLLFSASDLVVLPYTRIYSSGVLIRALGYGSSVIVSDQPAFTEIITDGINGLVFSTGDPVSLSSAVISYLSSKSLQTKISTNSAVFTHSHFSWDVVGVKMNKIFHDFVYS